MIETDQRYSAAMDWLVARQSLGIDLGVKRVEELLEALGSPHRTFRSIHVAGTNGKGSVTTLLAEVLRLSGHRTGLYTSPHLVEFSERIRIDASPISRDEITSLIDRLRPVVADMDRFGLYPTFFELFTVMAFMHFAQRRVSWAVVEAGMGGARDATNVLAPVLTIITNVSVDHTPLLGDDVRDIAREKAGMMKPGTPLVTAATGEALRPLANHADEIAAPAIVVGSDYLVVPKEREMLITHHGEQRTYELRMSGQHQVENASVVIAACDELRRLGVRVSEVAMRQALATTAIPGRLETLIRDDVEVTIDGAHNVAAVQAVVRHLSRSGRDFDLILGFTRDKDWMTMVQHLMTLTGSTGRLWAVPTRSPRGVEPSSIRDAIGPATRAETARDFAQAWDRAREGGTADLLVTGSLFLAGEARAVLTDHDLSEIGGYQ